MVNLTPIVSSTRTFEPVDATHPERLQVITDIFNRVLTPLYGPQDKAIKQIAAAEDRKAFLLLEDKEPKACLVFKTRLSDEYASFGINKSIEIKSLFIDHPEANSGRGLGSLLLGKLFEEIAKLPIKAESVHVTVSETKTDSLEFFLKKDFKVVHSWSDRYKESTIEHLLCRALKPEAA